MRWPTLRASQDLAKHAARIPQTQVSDAPKYVDMSESSSDGSFKPEHGLDFMPETGRIIAFGLAEAFLRGQWEVNELAERANTVLVPRCRRNWIKSLARRAVIAFHGQGPPREENLIRFLENDEEFCLFLDENYHDCGLTIDIDLSRLPRPKMQPAAGAASTWDVRPLTTIGEVANWLGVTPHELDWFADCHGREAKLSVGPLRHYRYRWIAKSSGGRRLLEVPKSRLKRIQRFILDDILNKITPHSAAHAFRPGRSVASYVAPHTGKRIVLHIDLREFFPSVRASGVHAIFRTAGYPERVASILTGLCTNATPTDVFVANEIGNATGVRWKRYSSPHLPQGAPTSPALANLAAFWLDCRMIGLARKTGAVYTRYADDLVFSGGAELERCLPRFRVLVAAIVHHEGFEIRHRKTREMRSGSRQQVAGVILNQRPNIPRREYDLLRATLHNCRYHGPESQNIENHPHFREHLIGRISYWSTICPERARKLMAMFEKISWS